MRITDARARRARASRRIRLGRSMTKAAGVVTPVMSGTCTLVIALVLSGTLCAREVGTQRADTTHTDSIRRLAPAIVNGTRLAATTDRRAPGMTDVFGRSSGSAGVAAASDAVSQLVGVSAYNDQGARAQPTLQIRGFSLSPVVGVAQGISVFLDGVRINEPDAQELFFELIPFAVVERAELTRGAAAGHGKNSLGGVLNLVTRRGDSPGVPEARVSIGSFGSLDVHVTAGGKRGVVDGLVMMSTITGKWISGTIGRHDQPVVLDARVARCVPRCRTLPAGWPQSHLPGGLVTRELASGGPSRQLYWRRFRQASGRARCSPSDEVG